MEKKVVHKTDFAFLRKRVKDKSSLKRLKEIMQDWILVRENNQYIKGKYIFKIRIGKYNLFMRKSGASSSIDIYLEVFKDKHHMKLPAFQGKKDKVVVDLGANEGYYALGMKENNPKLKIISVEPAPETFQILKKNITGNKLKDVVAVKKAVSAKNGKITFEIVPEVTAIGSLNIGLQKRVWLDKKRIKKISVDSITLTELCRQHKIDKIDILKIDVEGAELDILKSSKALLKNVKKVVIEKHVPQITKGCIEFMKNNGFKLILQEKERCGDLYFVNKSPD